jgi:hypothetical protein
MAEGRCLAPFNPVIARGDDAAAIGTKGNGPELFPVLRVMFR